MVIAKNSVVSMNYKVATAAGEHVDASQPGEPLVWLAGQSQIIPGLESALIGKNTGDKLAVDVLAKDAYGEIDEELDIKVLKSQFPPNVQKQLKEGFQFRAEHPTKEGEDVIFTIHGIEGDDVFVSGNHPLAGENLHFEVEIVSVRPATKEELEHGHAHGPGGHHHH
jgi:FKBP-type peptidyl-prolyl cis-trans isomerase SlyD